MLAVLWRVFKTPTIDPKSATEGEKGVAVKALAMGYGCHGDSIRMG